MTKESLALSIQRKLNQHNPDVISYLDSLTHPTQDATTATASSISLSAPSSSHLPTPPPPTPEVFPSVHNLCLYAWTNDIAYPYDDVQNTPDAFWRQLAAVFVIRDDFVMECRDGHNVFVASSHAKKKSRQLSRHGIVINA